MRINLTLILLASFLLLERPVFAQSYAQQQSIQLQASVDTVAPSITLSWLNYPKSSNPASIYRKTKGAASWGALLKSTTDTFFTDTNVKRGQSYEYRVARDQGNGYIFAGMEFRPDINRGKLVLVVDDFFKTPLSSEIQRLVDDIEADGWQVTRLDVKRTDTPQDVRSQIKAIYDQDKANTRGLFLLGHVPVPYAGVIAPDGHVPDHQGAWPADVYYADINGNWTDASVNYPFPGNLRQQNIPGDGKLDQSSLPSNVELMTGRVDFYDMPSFTEGETELMRKYLDKNHAFRTKMFELQPRGVIEDNFQNYAEGFSQNGWKNFPALFGIQNAKTADYGIELKSKSALFAYGCGGGWFQGASGIFTTGEYAADSLLTVFNFIFGSYFGDWDTQNNFLRASLGSGTILTAMWAGRPHWMVHHMGLGECIGYGARLSQNNDGVLYTTGAAPRSIHIALLGDPTLRLQALEPMQQLLATEIQGHVKLTWDAGSAGGTGGYDIHRRILPDGLFEFVAHVPAEETEYLDSCLVAGKTYEYTIRRSQLTQTGSGTYYNTGNAARTSLEILTDNQVTADFSYSIQDSTVTFANASSANSDRFLWSFGDGAQSTQKNPVHTYPGQDSYDIKLIAYNACYSDTVETNIAVFAKPKIQFQADKNLLCAGQGVQFTDQSQKNVYAWLWSFPGGNPATSTAKNPAVTYMQAGKFDVKLAVANPSGWDTLNFPEYVRVRDIPDASFSYAANLNTVSFTDLSQDADSRLWNFGDGNTSTEAAPVHVYTLPGAYTASLKAGNLCGEDEFSQTFTLVFTGTNERPGLSVKLYPNPASGRIFLESDQIGRVRSLQFFDLQGRLLMEMADPESQGQRMEIPLSGSWEAGTYILHVITDLGTAAQRILIQR